MGNKQPYQQLKQSTLRKRDLLLVTQKQHIQSKVAELNLTELRAKDIANLTVVQIVDKLNTFQLTSEVLLTALAWRTITVGKELNAFIYLYYDEALEIAVRCDQQRKQQKKRNITLKDMANLNKNQWNDYFPLLYGVPISIKDVYHFQGRLATIGVMKNASKSHPQSPLILCFRNAGMIPFVQTNVPQMGMTFQTDNNLWGRTVNPWNRQRTCGGSSGGEGAMISSRCSVLGVGSDIGGSIRIPSEFCGVFGLKPHSKRISSSYHAALSKAFEGGFVSTVHNNIGPLAKSAEDLALFMTVATTEQYYQNKHDPYTKCVQFDAETFRSYQNEPKKLRIGYFKQLIDLKPSTATSRAHTEVLELLQRQGHELVEIKIPNQREILRSFCAEFSSCSGENYKQILRGQHHTSDYQSFLTINSYWWPRRFWLSTQAKQYMYRSYFYFLQKKPFPSVLDYQKHVGQVNEFRQQWIAYWRQQNLDFVVAPGFGCQAFPHGFVDRIALTSGYTFIWNMLDMASVCMPVTKVGVDEQEYISRINDPLTQDLKAIAKGSLGLPVGVQIVGLPYEQQKVLGFASLLQKQIKFYEKHGLPPGI